ncbi:MAG: MraY family glycosyltransferase [Desulfobacterales bacterium]
MTSLLLFFILSLGLSLVFTPISRALGSHLGAMDKPNKRKVHSKPIPRTGGLAIFAAFCLTIISVLFVPTKVAEQFVFDKKEYMLILGGFISFGIGLVDDFKRLGPKIKLCFQILAASAAFYGGTRIYGNLGGIFSVESMALSFLLTVFWFVFLINAINLVDGLDGLAGGVVFFASVIILILSLIKCDYVTCILFAALAGSTLGFLRYNFNPASIFLGDGGSYFLGYAIAGFSIMGSVKSQMSAALLIPLLALGVPLFDAILSPVRRFILGRKLFHPDKGHIHHMLIGMGFSTRKAVWTIYLISIGLCAAALIIVNLRDERAGLFLILLGFLAIFFVRKLGYLEYFEKEKIFRWFRDVTDEVGFTNDRRSFLNLQIELDNSKSIEEIWKKTCIILETLKLDQAEMTLEHPFKDDVEKITWIRNGKGTSLKKSCDLFRIEMPLISNCSKIFGRITLYKDLRESDLSHYALKRIEHFRRTLVETLQKLEKNYHAEEPFNLVLDKVAVSKGHKISAK